MECSYCNPILIKRHSGKTEKLWGVSITDSAAGFYPALWGFDSLTPRHIGPVAQSVEQGTLNAAVDSSTLSRSTIFEAYTLRLISGRKVSWLHASSNLATSTIYGFVAQLVEQRIENPRVGGSTPPEATF